MRISIRFLCGLATVCWAIPLLMFLVRHADHGLHNTGVREITPLTDLEIPSQIHDVRDEEKTTAKKVVKTPVIIHMPTIATKNDSIPVPGLAKTLAMKRHVRETCLAMGLLGNSDNLAAYHFNAFVVDDKHKLLHCLIPKVASTTWRRVFLQLSGKLDTDAFKLLGNDIHHKYRSYISSLGDFPPKEIKRRLRDYYKFVFVRDPFERLVSAYKSKFSANTLSAKEFKWTMGREIIKQYRKPEEIPANNTGFGVRFGEFVDYLTDPKKKLPMNEHWDLFYRLCHPCHINYDYYGRLETLEEDVNNIIEINSLPDNVKLPSRRSLSYGYKETKHFVDEFYTRLTPPQIGRLYGMYKRDFRIFNYSMPLPAKSPT